MRKAFRKVSGANGAGARAGRVKRVAQRGQVGIRTESLESRVMFATGLVAAYGFDEGAGAAVSDASGTGNNGTASNTTWSAGKFGSALSFNGTNSWVTVADSASLRLTTGMTLEAWVNPRSTSAIGTAVLKE